jgi:Mrp family chromosome partitioning ATPase
MVVACWSPKGGSGTTVVAVALARLLANANGESVLVDLGGDAAAVLGVPDPDGPGVAEWLEVGDDVPADGLARIEHDIGSGLSLVTRGAGRLSNAPRAEVLAAVLAADRRPVIVDCGRVVGIDDAELGRLLAATATHSLLVVRPCYLALRRAVAMDFRPSGVVVVDEPGRALDPDDLGDILQVPVVAVVAHDDAVGRAVDAGMLGDRMPSSLRRALRRAA